MEISFIVSRRAVGTILILSFLVFIAEASDSSTVNFTTNQSITAFSICKKVTNGSGTGLNVYVPTQSSAEWASFYNNPPAGVTIGSCATPITIATSQSNADLCTIAGNPTTPSNYVFTIPAGTIISSNSTGVPALTTGTCWPAGSSITLINDGSIYGRGGDGGSGPHTYTGTQFFCNGYGGGVGGPAVGISYPLTIDNTHGYIFGGGGGGGGGGAASGVGTCYYWGGGGGGGQGSISSNGGGGGPGGSSGGAGTIAGPGAGGAGGSYSRGYGGAGGTGGSWGVYGSSGGSASWSGGTGYGGAGGAGGPAITGAGYGITWLGGNNGSQVRGAVQ